MKKIALIVVSAVLAVASARAQGLVSFNNSSAAGSKISTNAVVGGAATGLTSGSANSFYYALFASAASTTVNGASTAVVPSASSSGTYAWSDASWAFAGYAASSGTAGRVLGSTTQSVPGVAAGSSAYFVVVGWSANLGTTWSEVLTTLASGNWVGNAYIGQSAVSALVTTGDGANLPTPTILAASGAVTGFTLGLVPVPEPGTMALAALGGASLLLFRRRK